MRTFVWIYTSGRLIEQKDNQINSIVFKEPLGTDMIYYQKPAKSASDALRKGMVGGLNGRWLI